MQPVTDDAHFTVKYTQYIYIVTPRDEEAPTGRGVM